MQGSFDGYLTMGAVVDRYQIVGFLCMGATGVVYAVRHTALGVDRAMKVVNASSPEQSKRLVREGTVLAKLHHPNVVAIHDVIEVTGPDGDTRPALILDRVDGPTMDQFLSQARPASDDAIALWRGIVAGVAAAHAAGMVHRDLKPANVLLDVNTTPPTPRVVDFGLVTEAPGVRSNLTGAGFMGTFGYAAPEQFDKNGECSSQSDVFSLGILGFELLTGRHPFEDRDPSAVIRAMRTGAFERPAALRDSSVGDLITRCLHPDPASRPADAREVLDAMSGDGPTPTTSPAPAPKPANWPRGIFVVAGCAGVVLVGYAWVANNDLGLRLEATEHELLAERADTHPSHAIAHARAAASLRGESTLDPRWVAQRIEEGGAAWHFPAAETPYTTIVAANHQLVAASAEGQVTVWEAASGDLLGEFDLGMRVPTNARTNLDGDYLIIGPDAYLGGTDSHVVVRGLPDGRPLASMADTVSTAIGADSGERACVSTITGEGQVQLSVLNSPHWTVDRQQLIARAPLGPSGDYWARCGDSYWIFPSNGGVQVDYFDGPSTFYEGVDAFNASATPDGLYVPADGAVQFIASDSTRRWFRPSDEALEMFATLSHAGLFIGRTTTSGWTIHGPSGRVKHIPGLVQWGIGQTVPLVVGLRDGTVQRHNGDVVTSYAGTNGRILSVSESQTGLLAASGLGRGVSAWPALSDITGEVSRQHARNGSWLGTGTDVVWAEGATVLRTNVDKVEEWVTLPEEILLINGDAGPGVAALGRTSLYALVDGEVLPSGTHAGRVWPRTNPVILSDQFVEVTSFGLLVHHGDEETLRTLSQLEAVVANLTGDTLWLATGRDETAVVSRLDASLTLTPLSHDVNDAVGVSVIAPQADGGALVGTWSGHTLVWRGDAPVVDKVLGPIDGPVNAVDAHEDRIAVGGWNGTVHVFDADQLAWSAPIGAQVASLAWSPDGRFLAAGDDSGGLTLFDESGAGRSMRIANHDAVDVRWEDDEGPVTLDSQGVRIRWQAASLLNDLSTVNATGALTNIRICRDTLQPIAVVPYPSEESIWAPSQLCNLQEHP